MKTSTSWSTILTSSFESILQLDSIFNSKIDSVWSIRILLQPYFREVTFGTEPPKRFFSTLNSLSGELELHHINTFKNTGQKCSFCLGSHLYMKSDLKSPASSASLGKPGSCSGLSEQMWVDLTTYWEVGQPMVLLAWCSLLSSVPREALPKNEKAVLILAD